MPYFGKFVFSSDLIFTFLNKTRVKIAMLKSMMAAKYSSLDKNLLCKLCRN
jgi:hypothetical protein